MVQVIRNPPVGSLIGEGLQKGLATGLQSGLQQLLSQKLQGVQRRETGRGLEALGFSPALKVLKYLDVPLRVNAFHQMEARKLNSVRSLISHYCIYHKQAPLWSYLVLIPETALLKKHDLLVLLKDFLGNRRIVFLYTFCSLPGVSFKT